MAKKYFGEEYPIGKVIKINNEHSFKVTGIIKETPTNSSFRFDMCIPFEYIKKFGHNLSRYGWNSYFVYVELTEGTDYKKVNEKIKDYLIRKKAEVDEGEKVDLFLFPLKNVHLYSWSGGKGDIQYIFIFSAIAVFILLIACINFMNLSTARSAKRSREIAIRKTVGADRNNLIRQFIGESMILTVFAFGVSLILVHILLPFFNDISEKKLIIDYTDIKMWFGFIIIIFTVGLLAGSYPAFYLSSFNPVKAMKSGSHKGKGNFYFRRILVVFQFALSVFLIISTIVIYKQLSYVQNKELGMDTEDIMLIVLRGDSKEKFTVFKTELQQNPNITNITRASHLPFMIGSNGGGFEWEGKNPEDDVLIGFGYTGTDYIETLNMKLSSGRYYKQNIQTDSAAIVINQKAAKIFDMKEPVGQWLKSGDDKYKIIGMVEDFHFLPMQYSIDPLILFYNPEICRYMYIKIASANKEQTIEYVQKTWGEINTGYPFKYEFLDDVYKDYYTDEARLTKIIGYFALLAIFISCLGLFGLAAFMAEQRTKEIGIRKVLGASVSGVISLVAKDFMKWVIIANIIAYPFAWLAMDHWLNGYVYHTKLSADIFFYAFILSVAIAVITISYQSIKSAIRNPVTSIKYE